MALLEVTNLDILFGGLRAAGGLNIFIGQRELYSLIGPNDVGKTMIFSLLTSVYKSSLGSITLDGDVVTGHKTVDISKTGIARTFQDIRLFRDLIVLNNVKMGLHSSYTYSTAEGILRLSRYLRVEKEMDEKTIELLRVFDLGKESQYLAPDLPYGKQRKLKIVRALVTEPKLLSLGEPAAGMSPNEIKGLMDTIRFMRGEFEITIPSIEHDMRLVSGTCEKLTMLSFGQVLTQGATSDVLSSPEVIEVYLGEQEGKVDRHGDA